MTPEDPKPEEKDYSLKALNDGQAQINYVFNHVDMNLIEALKFTVEFLKRVKDLPSLMHDLKGIDFTKIDEELSLAAKHSKLVADIKPPGCQTPPAPYPY
jgi:hypothetical protein